MGFTTGKVFGLKSLEMSCGKGTLEPILNRFQLRNRLDHYQKKIFITSYDHPLLELDQNFQPEVLKNEIDRFIFRAKVALSCLIEENIEFTSNYVNSVTFQNQQNEGFLQF